MRKMQVKYPGVDEGVGQTVEVEDWHSDLLKVVVRGCFSLVSLRVLFRSVVVVTEPPWTEGTSLLGMLTHASRGRSKKGKLNLSCRD